MAEHMQADPGRGEDGIQDSKSTRRIVITGLGVLACNGIGKEDFWQACISGRSGIRHITRFDASSLSAQIAGEIAHFDPEAVDIHAKKGFTWIAARSLLLQQ